MALAGQNPADKSRPGPPPGENPDAGEVTREMMVGPLLARANLLRMRGQWDEAIAVCTEALLHVPKSPTAHSVLGDIYEAQGKYDDALQWYGMAIDLAPNRTADREKLERIVAVQRERLRAMDKERSAGLQAHRAQMAGKLNGFPASQAPGNRAGTGGRAAAERTVEWFDRVFPPGRSESIARLIFALCGIIAVLIASAAVFVYTSSGRTRSGTSLLAEGGTNASGLPSLAAPVRVIVPSVRVSTPARESAVAKITPSVAAPATPGSSVSLPGTSALLSQLAQSLPPGVAVTALRGDGGVSAPYQLEIALPKSVSEAPESTQERFLRGAALAARTLALLDSRSTQIVVRASLREGVIAASGSLPAPSSPRDIPVFQGSVAAAAIRGVDPSITPTATLLTFFTEVSWSPAPSEPVSATSADTSPPSGAVSPAAALTTPAPP